MNMAAAMKRAEVLEFDLQRQLVPHMQHMVPLPSIYYPDFIAGNQGSRADNVLPGTKQQHLEHIRKDIREFKGMSYLRIVFRTRVHPRFLLEYKSSTIKNKA